MTSKEVVKITKPLCLHHLSSVVYLPTCTSQKAPITQAVKTSDPNEIVKNFHLAHPIDRSYAVIREDCFVVQPAINLSYLTVEATQ